MADGAICAIEKGLRKGAGSVHASCCLAHLLQPSKGGQVWSPQQGGQAGCVCVGGDPLIWLGEREVLVCFGTGGRTGLISSG